MSKSDVIASCALAAIEKSLRAAATRRYLRTAATKHVALIVRRERQTSSRLGG